MREYQEKNIYSAECDVKTDSCEIIEGNVSKEIEISRNTKACEIRADIEVHRRKTVRVWGQVRDCNGEPVKCAMVKLVKEVIECGNVRYEGIAHGITDCLGFYQFDICAMENCRSEKYRVFVSKQAVGEEIIIYSSECNPCNDDCHCAK